MVYYTQVAKREKRLAAYSRNYVRRRRMRLQVHAWRDIVKGWARKRVDKQCVEYETK